MAGGLRLFGEGKSTDRLVAVINLNGNDGDASGFRVIGGRQPKHETQIIEAKALSTFSTNSSDVTPRLARVKSAPAAPAQFRLVGGSPDKGKKGEKMPGVVASAATAIVYDIFTTQAGEEETLPDKVQDWFLRGVRKIYKAAKAEQAPILPLAQNFEKERRKIQRVAEKMMTLPPDGQVILGQQNFNNELARMSAEKAALLLALPDIGEGELTDREMAIAKQVAFAWLEKGEARAKMELDLKVNGLMGDLALSEMRDKMGAHYAQMKSDIAVFKKKKSDKAFAADPLTSWAFPNYKDDVAKAVDSKAEVNEQGKVAAAKAVTYSFASDGIHIQVYSKKKDKWGKDIVKPREVVMPWTNFMAKSEDGVKEAAAAGGMTYIAEVQPAKFAETLMEASPKWLRGLVSRTAVDDLVGMIVWRPAMGDLTPNFQEIPPMLVRSPKKVLNEIAALRKVFAGVAETDAIATQVLNSPENTNDPIVRPQAIFEKARVLEATDAIPILVDQAAVDVKKVMDIEQKLKLGTVTPHRVNTLNKEAEVAKGRARSVARTISERQKIVGDVTPVADLVMKRIRG